MNKINPLSFPAYYDMDGIPVRKRSIASLPEKLLPDGTWVKFTDPERFGTKAFRIPLEAFNSNVLNFLKPTAGV